MYWYGHGMNGWGYAVMTLGSLAFWALVVIAATALFRRPEARTHGQAPDQGPPDRLSAEQVLAERFAHSEIDDDEYYRRLAVLESGRIGPRRERGDRR